jgi:hypothetical protein
MSFWSVPRFPVKTGTHHGLLPSEKHSEGIPESAPYAGRRSLKSGKIDSGFDWRKKDSRCLSKKRKPETCPFPGKSASSFSRLKQLFSQDWGDWIVLKEDMMIFPPRKQKGPQTEPSDILFPKKIGISPSQKTPC